MHFQSPEPDIQVEIRPADLPGFAAIMHLVGEHDLATSASFRDALRRINGNVLVDLSECSFVDSSVIAVLFGDQQARAREGQRLELLVPPGGTVARTLHVAGIAALIPVRTPPLRPRRRNPDHSPMDSRTGLPSTARFRAGRNGEAGARPPDATCGRLGSAAYLAVIRAQCCSPYAERCQARPAATLRGFREDVLCASMAGTSVRFRNRDIPVCHMHERVYARWGSHADANAERLWGWTREGASSD